MDYDSLTAAAVVDSYPEITDIVLPQSFTDSVKAVRESLDYSGLGTALQNAFANIPKIDTSAMTTALSAVAAAGSALSSTVHINESAQQMISTIGALTMAINTPAIQQASTALSEAASMVASATEGVQALGSVISDSLPDFETVNVAIGAELEVAEVMTSALPKLDLYSTIIKPFSEHFSEMVAAFCERMNEIGQRFYTMLHELWHRFMQGVHSVVSWVFRPSIPRIAVNYDFQWHFKSPIILFIVRRFMEYAPRIRKAFLHRGRERGTDTDDADFGFLVTC